MKGRVRRVLRRAGLRSAQLGLVFWRSLRPPQQRAGERGFLLGRKKDRTVVLVWCLGADDPEAAIAERLDVLNIFDVAVIVVDDWNAADALRDVGFCVVVPDRETQARLRPGDPWETWEKNRFAAIRYDWAPDFELDLGDGKQANSGRVTPLPFQPDPKSDG